jgi:hypothetical protein
VYRLIADDSTAYKSKKSAKISQSIASANATNVRAFYNNMPMEKNKTYTIAFWAKVDAKDGDKRELALNIQTLDVTPKQIFNKTITLDSVDWKEYVYVVPPKDLEGPVRVEFLVGLSAVDFWFDDFRFFEGEPSDEIKGVTMVKPINKMPISWGEIKK